MKQTKLFSIVSLIAVVALAMPGCDTVSQVMAKMSPQQKAAFAQMASTAATVAANVINAATSLGIARIESKIPVSDNPYLASAAVGLRTLQGTALVTPAQIQDIVATFGDPSQPDKFAALGGKVSNIVTDYGTKPITDATLEAAATALNQLNAAAARMQAQAGSP